MVEPGNAPTGMYQVVSPNFFETLRVPLRAARFLSINDSAESPSVAVISERMTCRWWNTESPIGWATLLVAPMQPPASGELLLFGLAANSIARTGSIVEDKISLAFVDYHRDVRAVDGWAPLVRHSAVRTYRIGSREFGWLHVVSRDSYEKLSGEIALAVEGEPANGSEVPDTNYRSPGTQTIAAMQGGV
jgi:hypothetical protein